MAIRFTSADFHFSEAQHSSTGYSSLTRRVQTESCWDLATYFHELIVNSGGINYNVMNNVHLHITS